MSINDKFTYLQQTKEVIKKAIIDKGVEVTDTDTFRSYADKITAIKGGGGDTIYAYTSDLKLTEGDKAMLTKVTSLVVPDADFCQGFRPCFFLNGEAYGFVGDSTYPKTPTQVRQVINGVIDASTSKGCSASSSYLYFDYSQAIHYGLNNTVCSIIALNGYSFEHSTQSNRYTCFAKNAYISQISYKDRGFYLENCRVNFMDGSGAPSVFNYDTSKDTQISGVGAMSGGLTLAFEKGDGYVYMLRANSNWSSTASFYKVNITDNTYEYISNFPTLKVTGAFNESYTKSIYLQTKDYKYLLHRKGYIDVSSDSTITLNDYPTIVSETIGDRNIRNIQVYYGKCFSLHLGDGVTVFFTYTNDMSDLKVSEIVEPLSDGTGKVYTRSYSADRALWVQMPTSPSYNNYDIMMLADIPAGQNRTIVAESDYMASTPSKDKFNSTVLTGFLTGETKEEDGRKLIEVKTALGV